MLKARVITALVLLVVFLAAIFLLPREAWALFAGMVGGLAAWEWGGFLGFGKRARQTLGVITFLFSVLIVALYPEVVGAADGFVQSGWALGRWLYGAAWVFWVGVVPFWFVGRWKLHARWLGCLVGIVVIIPTWLALSQLRNLGPWPLLALMAVVWIADIAAYFSGKAFGRHKLAPSISPGKTWEGAAGALVGVTAYGFLLNALFPDYLDLPAYILAPALWLFTAASIAGDLFESLLKRQAGIKDSSSILPGHGGVLDRIDSLTSTLPLLAGLWLYLQQ